MYGGVDGERLINLEQGLGQVQEQQVAVVWQ